MQPLIDLMYGKPVIIGIIYSSSRVSVAGLNNMRIIMFTLQYVNSILTCVVSKNMPHDGHKNDDDVRVYYPEWRRR